MVQVRSYLQYAWCLYRAEFTRRCSCYNLFIVGEIFDWKKDGIIRKEGRFGRWSFELSWSCSKVFWCNVDSWSEVLILGDCMRFLGIMLFNMMYNYGMFFFMKFKYVNPILMDNADFNWSSSLQFFSRASPLEMKSVDRRWLTMNFSLKYIEALTPINRCIEGRSWRRLCLLCIFF